MDLFDAAVAFLSEELGVVRESRLQLLNQTALPCGSYGGVRIPDRFFDGSVTDTGRGTPALLAKRLAYYFFERESARASLL